MGLLKEFKEFAVKGNMADMAVGIIIGAAFGRVVSSLVKDVLTPPLGILIGGVDFTGLSLTLKQASEVAPAVTLNYGLFLQSLFDFIIVAFAIFMVIKGMNVLRRNEEEVAAEAPTPADIALLTDIRDILKTQNAKH